MAGLPLQSMLRAACATLVGSGVSDRVLIERYATARDEQAFAELLDRHGAMVLGVCRRILGNDTWADDACQATFVVLARRAGAICWRSSLAGWLHRVARRVALKASARRSREQRLPDEFTDTAAPASELAELRELHQLIDAEVDRLPEQLRLPVVHCCLQDQTLDEAARLLGWSLTTVKGRLQRGRLLLRARLERRGILLSVGSLVLLAGSSQGQSLHALKSATLLALAQGSLPPRVAALSQGVLRSMFTTRVLSVAACLGLLILCGAGSLALWAVDYTLPPVPEVVLAAVPADDPLAEKEPPFDKTPLLQVIFKELNQRFGIALTKENDPRNPEEKKRLTYAQDGSYNNTCIKIDGYENLFGQNPGQWDRDDKGPIKQRETIKGRQWVSIWKFPQNVFVTQTLTLIPNDATRKLDTFLVHYQIENRDSRLHTVGLRAMLDTYVGANDGMSFLIPGRDGLVDTKLDISNAKDVPPFLQALEIPDLAKPGVVFQMNLQLPAGLKLNKQEPPLEPVTRLVLSRFPGNPEIRWDFVKEGKFWAMNDKAKGMENDSCVTMYWDYQPLPPKGRRAMAYTIGLGKLSSMGHNNARIGLTVGGQPQPGKLVTVTAWLRDAKPGQLVKLALPAGMKFAEGSQPEQRSAGSGRLAQASWRVQIEKDAKPAIYQLKASAAGDATTADLRVRDDFNVLLPKTD